MEPLQDKATSSTVNTGSLNRFVKLTMLQDGIFPHSDDTSGGNKACVSLCHQEASQNLQQAGSRTGNVYKFHCKVCEAGYFGQPGKRVLLQNSQMRLHIASHILRGHIPPAACGYCGESTNPCVVSLAGGQSSKSRNAVNFAKEVAEGKIVDLDTGARHVSRCPCFYNFNMGSAKKANDRSNCSNVPMTCAECFTNGNKTTVVWKYATHQLYAKHHAGRQVLPDAYQVSAGEAKRLWNACNTTSRRKSPSAALSTTSKTSAAMDILS